MLPTLTEPRATPSTATTTSRAVAAAARVRRASGRSAWPAGVSSTFVVVRRKSEAPRSRSSARIETDSPDWTIWTRRAARVKLRSSAVATKCSSWRSSIESSFLCRITLITSNRWTA